MNLRVLAACCFAAQLAISFLVAQGAGLLEPRTLLFLGAGNAALGGLLLWLPGLRRR